MKLSLRSVESLPACTVTGNFCGEYESSFGTSSPSNRSDTSDSRDAANGLVLPSIASGLPSMRARSSGSTKMSVFDGSVAINGMPSFH